MRKIGRAVTRMSDKGQVILPKALRERRGWASGTEFLIEERPEGVYLRPVSVQAPATMDATFGRLRPAKKAITIDDMHEAMLEEARLRWSTAADENE